MNERTINSQSPVTVGADTLGRTTGASVPTADSTVRPSFGPVFRPADSVKISDTDFPALPAASVDTISRTAATLAPSVAPRPSVSQEHPAGTHMQMHSASDSLPHSTPLHSDFHERTDTPPADTQPDRPQDFPFRNYCASDSFRSPFDAIRTDVPHPSKKTAAQGQPASYREVSAQAVFGARTTLVLPFTETTAVRQMTDNSLFQGFVLLLAVTYVLLIYHNFLDIRTLLNRVFHDQTSSERRFEDPGGSRYIRFMRTTTSIGILFIGILVVKYAQSIDLAIPLDRFLFFVALALSLTVSAVFLFVIGFQWTLLRLVGALTLTQPLITQLQQLRKIYFSSAVVLTAPALFLFTLGPQQTERLWLGLVIAGSAVTLFLYLRETLNLFLSKKISIIHWILYLCAVELFPVSLIWQLAVR